MHNGSLTVAFDTHNGSRTVAFSTHNDSRTARLVSLLGLFQQARTVEIGAVVLHLQQIEDRRRDVVEVRTLD